jgi:hypothetical protein
MAIAKSRSLMQFGHFYRNETLEDKRYKVVKQQLQQEVDAIAQH